MASRPEHYRAMRLLREAHREEFEELLAQEYGRPIRPYRRRPPALVATQPARVRVRIVERCAHCGSRPTDPPFPPDQCPRCEPRYW